MPQIFSYSLALCLACSTTVVFCEETKSPSPKMCRKGKKHYPLFEKAETPSQEICQDGKKHHRLSVRHIEGGGIGYSQGYTTLEGFFAPDPQDTSWVPFLDVRGHVFDQGKMAANAGLGLRGISGCRAYGLNAYYDYRNTNKLHYNQIGMGLETLGTLWDFRLNGYLPVGKKITAPYNVKFEKFSGHHLLLSQKRQFAMKGADAEVGLHFGKSANFDFYAAAGPYYYMGGIGPPIWGGKARVMGMYKDYIALEVSNSYDRMFHNNFQGQLTFSLPLGSKSRVKKTKACHSCNTAETIVSRMIQPVGREEIIVVGKRNQKKPAINPATGEPYFFVFVDNTSHSSGTYANPYHSFAQAQDHSAPNDILYVFPGDGTTTGMDSGIFLKANQKFWGSGISHLIQTSEGTISIPAQSSSSPTITNTNFDTEGNAVTLATNNAISGFNITSALNDAIFGTDPQSLEVSSCTIENTATFPIEATFSGDASISVTNNQFLNNTNGIFLTLHGTSTIACSNNIFEGQTSVSSVPLEIVATSNVMDAAIENNLFNNNITGSIRVNLTNALDVNIRLLNNTITNNGTGFESSVGSSFAIIPNGTNDSCSIALTGNTFSNNTSNSLYVDTSGSFTTFDIIASTNTMSDNGGSAIVFASECTTFTLNATNNTLTNLNNNGISTAGNNPFQTANITITGNTITNIGNDQSAISLAQGSSTLNFTAENNTIDRCEGAGILCFSSEFTNMTANIMGNTISNCLNNLGNAASGISLDTYVNLTSIVANNTLSDNVNPGVAVGLFTSGNPSVCLTLTGNSSDTTPGYSLTNPGSGSFNLSPCNVDAVNTGTIDLPSPFTPVHSCPEGTPCL